MSISLTAALVVVAVGCGTRPDELAHGQAELTWTDCGDGFECSSLTVPRDWAAPDGPPFDIALIRLPAPGGGAEGSIVVNWGGPGDPGVDSLRTRGTPVQEATGGTVDIVSFDPRGLGESEPILCPEGNGAYYNADFTTLGGLAQMADAVAERSYVCTARYGDYLGLIGTTQIVRDLDAIRGALGEDKLNYLGLSYGSRIGSVYAAMFPEHVGNMVLDGSMDPLSTLHSTATGNAASFEASLNEWFRRCEANPPCAFGDDAAAGFDEMVADVRANRPRVPGTDQRLTIGLLYQVFLAGIVNVFGLTQIAEQVIADFRTTGDPTSIYQVGTGITGLEPDGSYNSNAAEIFQFVNCIDWIDRPTLQQVAVTIDDVAEFAPRMGAFGVAFSYLNSTACPVPARATPVPTASDLPPIMVVGGTTDAEDPLNWSQDLSSALPNSFLLVSQQFGHTSFYTSPCVAEHAGQFLVSATLPATGTICPPP